MEKMPFIGSIKIDSLDDDFTISIREDRISDDSVVFSNINEEIDFVTEFNVEKRRRIKVNGDYPIKGIVSQIVERNIKYARCNILMTLTEVDKDTMIKGKDNCYFTGSGILPSIPEPNKHKIKINKLLVFMELNLICLLYYTNNFK